MVLVRSLLIGMISLENYFDASSSMKCEGVSMSKAHLIERVHHPLGGPEGSSISTVRSVFPNTPKFFSSLLISTPRTA